MRGGGGDGMKMNSMGLCVTVHAKDLSVKGIKLRVRIDIQVPNLIRETTFQPFFHSACCSSRTSPKGLCNFVTKTLFVAAPGVFAS